jgi:hypothetical protein
MHWKLTGRGISSSLQQQAASTRTDAQSLEATNRAGRATAACLAAQVAACLGEGLALAAAGLAALARTTPQQQQQQVAGGRACLHVTRRIRGCSEVAASGHISKGLMQDS